jgi:hypothetical protein
MSHNSAIKGASIQTQVQVGGMVQTVEHMPSRHKALSSNPCTANPRSTCHWQPILYTQSSLYSCLGSPEPKHTDSHSWCHFDHDTLNPRTSETIPGQTHCAPQSPTQAIHPWSLWFQLILWCRDNAGKGASVLQGPVSLRHRDTPLLKSGLWSPPA